MASITRRLPSGSTNGRPIAVAVTSSPGTTIHAPGATGIDMLTIWAKNTATVQRLFTLEWGGTATDDKIIKTLPADSGVTMIVDNMPINGTTATIAAFATATFGIQIFGYVDRIA